MGTEPKRPVASVFVLLFFFATLLFALLPGVFVAAQADPTPRLTKGPSVEVVEITPAILTDEEEVTIKVRLKGFKKGDENARLAAFVRADPFTSSEEVENFLAETSTDWWIAGELALSEETL